MPGAAIMKITKLANDSLQCAAFWDSDSDDDARIPASHI
jgi:hypothetical protein